MARQHGGSQRSAKIDRRTGERFPVRQWLRVGAVSAGLGVALVAAPAAALADTGGASAKPGPSSPSSGRSAPHSSNARSAGRAVAAQSGSGRSRQVALVATGNSGSPKGSAGASAAAGKAASSKAPTAGAAAQSITGGSEVPDAGQSAGGRAATEDSDNSLAARAVGSGMVPSATPAAMIADAVRTTAARVASPPARATPVALGAAGPIVTAEVALFNRMADWLAGLPENSVTTYLEGTQLIVRKRFFNTGPTVTPVQSTSAGGTIKGTIGAIDPEGDDLNYSVVAEPAFGIVAVSGNGRYTYTPGSDYAGSDSFTVKVTPDQRTFNLLDPWSDGSRVVTIQVGSQAPTNPFGGSTGQAHQDPTDVALYLPNASGHITVNRSGLLGRQFKGTVTLNDITPDTQLTWMDASGNLGRVSVDELVTVHWPELQAKANSNGAGVDLSVVYTDAEGVNNALILSHVQVSEDAAGQFVFTGQLSPDPELQETGVDVWDVVGASYKPLYENFRRTFNIEKGQTADFTTVDLDFAQAAVFVDTYTPISYEQDGLYTQTGRQAAPTGGAAPPQTSAPVEDVEDLAGSGVTASIALGRSFLIGRNDGTVELWTDGQKQLLHDTGWRSPVVHIMDYSRPLKDLDGNTIASNFTGTIAGDILTVKTLSAGSTVVVGQEITGEGVAPGTVITEFINQKAQCNSGTCDVGTGGLDGGPGTYKVSISQTVGDPANNNLVITQPDVPATAASFIVGLGNGAIEQWSQTTGWTELHDGGWGAGVTTMTTYGEGFVVGLDNGAVERWIGPAGAPDTWRNNWTELHGQGWGQAVSSMVTYRDGIIVGLGTESGQLGGVEYYTNGQWVELHDTGWGSPVTTMITYLDGVVVGLANGSVQQWTGESGDEPTNWKNNWFQLQDNGWGQAVSSMITYGDGFILGLGKGANVGGVEYYTGIQWIELHDSGWQTPVRNISTYSSAGIGSGVVVGLDNGSVQLWNGITDGGSGQGHWTELHDPGWESGIATLIPFRNTVTNSVGNVVNRDGVVVGLDNGAVEQWKGVITGATGQGDWVEIVGPQTNQAAQILKDGGLEKAVTFAKSLPASPNWGADGVGGESDPIFSQSYFQPPCASTNNCDGTYQPIVMNVPGALAGTSFAVPNTDASVDLSFDANTYAYGYAFVPNSIWDAMLPGAYTIAMVVALETGPSLKVNLQADGSINSPVVDLVSFQQYYPTAFGAFALDEGVNAQLTATLEGVPESGQLNAHAYMVPGMLFTFNTEENPGWVELGFNAYPDVDYSDFMNLTGISVTPTVTPYVTATYGFFLPDDLPLVGGLSLFDVALGYENPMSATIAVTESDGASLTLDAQGYITAHAGILDTLTDWLTWEDRFQVYDISERWPNASVSVCL